MAAVRYTGPAITLRTTPANAASANMTGATATAALNVSATLAANASAQPAVNPTLNATGDAALAYLNARRREVGLKPLAFDPDVAAAAASHARYLVLNGAHGHDEIVGAAGFTGPDVTSRVRRHATVAIGAGEVLSVVGGAQDMSVEAAVQQIFASPYHRGAMLFDWARAGVAADGRSVALQTVADSAAQATPRNPTQHGAQSVTVIDFADIADPLPDTQLVAWPYDRQRDVPLSWTDIEQPDPMGPGSGYFGQDVGFPITLSGGPNAHIVLRSVDLRDARGHRVACHIAPLTAADTARNTAICTPYRPLAAGTRYTVHAQGALTQATFADAPFDLQWSFETQASPAKPSSGTLTARN